MSDFKVGQTVRDRDGGEVGVITNIANAEWMGEWIPTVFVGVNGSENMYSINAARRLLEIVPSLAPPVEIVAGENYRSGSDVVTDNAAWPESAQLNYPVRVIEALTLREYELHEDGTLTPLTPPAANEGDDDGAHE